MKILNQTIDFDQETRIYDVVIEDINEEVFGDMEDRFIEAGFTTESYEDGELTIAISKDRFGFTKADFIKEVRRIAKGK